MVRKIFLLALFTLPSVMFAQEAIKLGHINSMEVMSIMPEVKLMQDSLQKQALLADNTLKELEDEYNKKMADYIQARDTLQESINTLKIRELESIRERMQAFEQDSRQRLQELQQRLLTPIQEKFKKALDEVSVENHFTYIIDSQALLYAAPQSHDVVDLVKAKLGLR
ncbi:MAG: OmpH family outer membrane protein [Dysgonamonadaceae bacterium]|jgi:outer membrane protein|nr:OmpH family outer membrane protein [Dysgonamonadaceae bacterium]